jgi:transposase-like protein
MAELFTQEQARVWLRENNLKTGKSIQDAFINEIKGVLQEALEEEMNNTLGYSKYDYTSQTPGTPNRSRAAGHVRAVTWLFGSNTIY